MQHHNSMERNQEQELSEITDKLGETLTLDSSTNHQHNDYNHVIDEDDAEKEMKEDDDEDEDEDGDFEFSFVGSELKSPVSADDAFHNGQIRPIFPFFGEIDRDSDVEATTYGPPVKKVFLISPSEKSDDVAEGPYCVWSIDTSTPENMVSPAPEMSRKSNSTGFSRLWRMKDLLVRSNSDGKDTLVFVRPSHTRITGIGEEAVGKEKKKANLERIKVGGRKNGGETMSKTTTNGGGERKVKKVSATGSAAAYEALYGKKKGGGKSYLPYRQDLVGLFTNVNGLTRNVHPY